MELFEAHHIKPNIRDERCAGHSIDVKFCGQLRPSQQDAVSMIAEHDDGILCAPTAFGKTAVAAWLIAARKVNTLVLVHRQQLLDQWHERLAMFLNLSAESIGQVGERATVAARWTSPSSKAPTAERESKTSSQNTGTSLSMNATICRHSPLSR